MSHQSSLNVVLYTSSLWNWTEGMKQHSCESYCFSDAGGVETWLRRLSQIPQVFNWLEIWWLSRPYPMIHSFMFILIKPFTEHLCPVNGGSAIQEETIHIRKETFYHRIKVISQNNFGLICSESFQTMPEKCSIQHNRKPKSPSLQGSRI